MIASPTKISAAVFLAIALTLNALPASAKWTPLLTLGGSQLFSDPSCVSPTETGTAVCAAVGPAQRLIADRFDGTKWTGWVELGGTVASAPSCFAIEAYAVSCGARDTDGRLVTYTNDGIDNVWTAPNVVGGALADGPSCVSLTLAALCAARAIGGGLFSAEFKSKKLSLGGVWTILPTQKLFDAEPLSTVSCAADGLALADAYCIYDYGSGAVVSRFIGSTSTWDTANGVLYRAIFGPVGCAHFSSYYSSDPSGPVPSDNMVCYATGRDGYLYFTANHYSKDGGATGGGPSDYSPFSPTPLVAYVHSFSCAPASIINDEIFHSVCAATGTSDGSLYAFDFFDVYNGSENPYFLGPVAIFGGVNSPHEEFAGTPSCFVIAPAALNNGVMCVSRTVANVAESTTGP